MFISTLSDVNCFIGYKVTVMVLFAKVLEIYVRYRRDNDDVCTVGYRVPRIRLHSVYKKTEIRYKASILMLYFPLTVFIYQVMVASCADH